MAWTKKQLAEARRLYKAPRNKKTWSECIGIACKGAKRKATVSGTKKASKPRKTVKVVKARAKKVTVNMGSMGSIAMQKVKGNNSKIAGLERMLPKATTKTERANIRKAIGACKKDKNFWKKYL